MQGGVLYESHLLVPTIDFDEGGLGWGHAANPTVPPTTQGLHRTRSGRSSAFRCLRCYRTFLGRGLRIPAGHSGFGARAPRHLPWLAVRVWNKPRMAGESRQTRPGQPAAEKCRTVSAGLMRQYGTHPEKTRKSPSQLPASRRAAVPRPAFRPTRKRRTALPPPASTAVRRHDMTTASRQQRHCSSLA